jgi:3-methyladenine DNA glycosylase AlkC
MAEKLKDRFLTESSVGAMADELKRVCPSLGRKKLLSLVLDDAFKGRELMDRMRHATSCLREVLPKSYRKALAVLRKAAPGIKGCEALCLPDYVERFGLEDWDLSLDALVLFTKYSSSEFAIRPFIMKNPKRAMTFMKKIAEDGDEKVRRFASEGCRPRLPWAVALPGFKKNPSPIIPVLEKLKDDESEFVRRSVANNLNDISKDHAGLVLDIGERWIGKSEETDWIVKHACRTLLKAGDSRAMRLFGFGDPRRIAVRSFEFGKKKLAIGGRTSFRFVLEIKSKKACKVRLEYAVHFVKARGRTSPKVFKISEKTRRPGEHRISGNHAFADLSTRKHYPGEHLFRIIVNGGEKAAATLLLTE